jgi:hypothetical protein
VKTRDNYGGPRDRRTEVGIHAETSSEQAQLPNVMSTVAVVVALAGGSAWAAATIGAGDIKKNAVRSKRIKNGAVTRRKLADGAVNSARLASGAVRAPDLGKVIVVSDTITIPNHDNGQNAAFCPQGTSRIGGGGASAIFGMPIAGSRPDGDTAWSAFARNDTGASRA